MEGAIAKISSGLRDFILIIIPFCHGIEMLSCHGFPFQMTSHFYILVHLRRFLITWRVPIQDL